MREDGDCTKTFCRRRTKGTGHFSQLSGHWTVREVFQNQSIVQISLNKV